MVKVITRHPYRTHLWIDIWRSSNSCDFILNLETNPVNRSVQAELFTICHNSSLWELKESVSYTMCTNNVKSYWIMNYSRLLSDMCHADRLNSVVLSDTFQSTITKFSLSFTGSTLLTCLLYFVFMPSWMLMTIITVILEESAQTSFAEVVQLRGSVTAVSLKCI